MAGRKIWVKTEYIDFFKKIGNGKFNHGIARTIKHSNNKPNMLEANDLDFIKEVKKLRRLL